MRNVLKFMIAGTLAAGLASAQEKSESVESILKELGAATAKPAVTETPAPVIAAPADAPAPAVVEPAVMPAAAPAVEMPAVAAAPAMDLPAVIEESRDAYAGGEFERAQAGFEAVVKKDPENVIARMYLTKLMERDARKAEVNGMKEVTAGWKTALVLRSYAISPEAVEKMNLKDAKTATDVAAKFPEVNFPKGASAVYQPGTGKLFVRNTRENLTVLEEILSATDAAQISSDVDLVEIEAKFVEVSEGTLEQLGFEWRTLAGQDIGLGNGVSVPGGQYLFDDGLRGGPGNVSGMPFAQSAGMTGVSGDWTAFRMEDTFSTTPANMTLSKGGSTPLDMLITALDQTSGADVLSAPRVVTKSGKKATIRVGQMHYYPESYDVSASGGNPVYIKYEDWTETLLGVQLDVTPQVDGDQIELGLNPKFTELQGWQTYEVCPADSGYGYYQSKINAGFTSANESIAQLPVFRTRELKTEVTIADGATMGMGGLINERVESYEDKVPVLGSLPLVGRLFRNEGERAVKRNLLMFVTAKKVSPSGRVNTFRSFE